jgi:hypothetical protein
MDIDDIVAVTNGNGFDEDDKTIVTKGSTGINS